LPIVLVHGVNVHKTTGSAIAREALERIVERNGTRPELVVLRGKVRTVSRKTHASPVSRLAGR
jgi:hypothetical protein